MGYFFSCDYRAALDRAVHENIAPPEATQSFIAKQASPSPNADLGTCIHYTMFDGMGCEFDRNQAPTAAQWDNASTLFGGNLDSTKRAAFAAASLAAAHLPKGKSWRAEVRAKNRWTQGTIDLLTTDGEELWDLKTTSKPPLGGAIKAPHLYQLLTYRWLRKTPAMPKRGGVIYVDAIAASWCNPIAINYESEAIAELTEHIEQYARYLRSDRLFKHAVPRIGTHCSDDWCPYIRICKARFLPALSNGLSKSAPLPTTAAPSLATLGTL
jgi:hypothetical protein